jgi:hypothetical protein
VKSNTIKRCRIKKAAHRGGLSLGRKRPREANTTSLLRCTNAFRAFLVPIHKRTLILILLFRQNRTSVRVGLPALTAAAAVSVAVSRSRASGSWLHPRRIGAPRRWKLRIRIKRLGDVEHSKEEAIKDALEVNAISVTVIFSRIAAAPAQ